MVEFPKKKPVTTFKVDRQGIARPSGTEKPLSKNLEDRRRSDYGGRNKPAGPTAAEAAAAKYPTGSQPSRDRRKAVRSAWDKTFGTSRRRKR